jgi:tRNA U34 2-thiouridine synthase MnmA/TrmU
MKIALSLGADYVATGHYCRKKSEVEVNGQTVSLPKRVLIQIKTNLIFCVNYLRNISQVFVSDRD